MCELKTLLSETRLNRYKNKNTNQFYEIINLYLWNIKLSTELFSAISIFEVILRNKIDLVISNYLNKPDWLNEIYFIKCFPRAKIKETDKWYKNCFYEKVKNIKYTKLNKGKIIAELNFGFWNGLIQQNRFESNIWNEKKALNVFLPNSINNNPELLLLEFRAICENIRIIRNRIAHHEAIFDYKYNKNKDLSDVYNDLLKITGYISVEARDLIKNSNNFSAVWVKYTNEKS